MMVVYLLVLSALAGNEAENGGDPLRVLFRRAQHHAAMHVGAADFSDHPWLSERQEQLRKDLLASERVWIDEPQEECARTQPVPGATITLSLVSCRNASLDLKMAMEILIHESAHHLGVIEEREADRIAWTAMAAQARVVYRDTKLEDQELFYGLRGLGDRFIVEHRRWIRDAGDSFTVFNGRGEKINFFNRRLHHWVNPQLALVSKTDWYSTLSLQSLEAGVDPDEAPKIRNHCFVRQARSYKGRVYTVESCRGSFKVTLNLYDPKDWRAWKSISIYRSERQNGKVVTFYFGDLRLHKDKLLLLGDRLIQVYDLNLNLLYEKQLERSFRAHHIEGDLLVVHKPHYGEWSPQKDLLVTYKIDGLVEVARIEEKRGRVQGPYLVVQGEREFELWDLRTGKLARFFETKRSNEITSVAVSKDGLLVAAQESSTETGAPPQVLVWDVPSRGLLKSLPGLLGMRGRDLAFFDDGRKLVSNREKRFRVFYLGKGD